ncbi:PLP-dependent transferase [Sistotremastrum suecicum HHB10207 ss-3]|uniref:serine C-palmitoyltransferase n=1 Tax=Sistotremastrum suecicum HHB10207 ss-3 TaxID=1314776 RepID=A0A165Z4A5_9AGAM|nr:PLP-dependent transferase [Sistotremastrum suecicum HHB10207 ss-3]
MTSKKRSSPSLSGKSSAAEYLSALSHKDALARNVVGVNGSRVSSPSTTPALSIASSSMYTSSSDDTEIAELVDDGLSFPSVPPTSEIVYTTRHSEFGHCSNEAYRYTPHHDPSRPVSGHVEEDPPYYILFTTYISYLLLIIIGHIRDFFGKKFYPKDYRHLMPFNGYAALNSDFDSFYTRRLKTRLDDCFSRPVTGVPGRTITLLDRVSEDELNTFKFTGTKTRALNVSSYNYLGFAQARGACADAVEESLNRYGISACGSRSQGGTLDLHVAAEALVARFVGQEDALITSMGFATNSATIPALVGKGCLVISDEYNHASIRFGVRLSGASVRMFKHNDMKDLESLLREAISQGQPRTHRPWKKILLIVEGLYSMEGTLLDLPAIVKLKQKYKFYLYVDEAHSIGALGAHGRGVADYFNIPPHSIDILMGTFTKSFGAAGGYIAGSHALVSRLRLRSHANAYAESMAPAILTQIIASLSCITGVESSAPSSALTSSHTVTASTDDSRDYRGPVPASCLPSWIELSPSLRSGEEGRVRLRRLAFNARYLSRALIKLGFITYGHADAPIVPLLLFHPGKMSQFSRLMLERKTPIVVVVVGYPATPLVTSRVRFCLSASHTKEDVDLVLDACDEIGDLIDLKHGSGERWPLEEIKRRAVELVEME